MYDRGKSRTALRRRHRDLGSDVTPVVNGIGTCGDRHDDERDRHETAYVPVFVVRNELTMRFLLMADGREGQAVVKIPSACEAQRSGLSRRLSGPSRPFATVCYEGHSGNWRQKLARGPLIATFCGAQRRAPRVPPSAGLECSTVIGQKLGQQPATLAGP